MDLVNLDAGESDAMTKHAVLEVECGEPERPWERPRHLSTPARTDRCALTDAVLAEAGPGESSAPAASTWLRHNGQAADS